jgi:hypothetical protein
VTVREHDSGAVLTFNADQMDELMAILIQGIGREQIILADKLNRRWREAVDDHLHNRIQHL